MPLPLIPVGIGLLTGMFVGAQIDDKLEPSPVTPDNSDSIDLFTTSNALRLALWGGIALIGFKVAEKAKLL